MEVVKAARMGGTAWKLLLKNLNNDVLVEIFKHFDILESTSAVGRFVEALQRASNDQPHWQTLDFSMLKSNFIKTRLEPYVWVNSHSDTTLYNFLLLALDVSQGNIKTLIFHYNLYLTNDQFIYTARRYVIMYTFFLCVYEYNLIIVHFFPFFCIYFVVLFGSKEYLCY